MTLEVLRCLSGVSIKGHSNPAAGSNISITGNEKGELMKKHNIKPGTDEWFKLWFSLPYLTGETPVN
jgi:hypothetical protein